VSSDDLTDLRSGGQPFKEGGYVTVRAIYLIRHVV
jgi:hypothetical protein